MTFCIGVKVKDGLVAIADTRITSGSEHDIGKKLFIHQKEKHCLFIMTSGLRSLTDKAITYFWEAIEEKDEKFNKLYKAVNAFGAQVRRVAAEDKKYLQESGLDFNLNAIVGGQLEDDAEQKLYLLYPEGNWIENGRSSPFFIIGNSDYGKPLLNRALHFDSKLSYALKTSFLSFDATRISVNNVGYPIDVLIYRKNTFEFVEHRYLEDDLRDVSKYWDQQMIEAINKLPDDWIKEEIHKLSKPEKTKR
jgi:putative proteasome-type protease